MRATLSLLGVALWAAGSTATPTRGQQGQAPLASVDDVNVLTYGVLQLSDTVHHVYQSTARRMERVNAALGGQESTLNSLRDTAEQAAHTEQQIRHSLTQMQLQTAGLYAQAAQMRMMLQRAEQEEAELQRQVNHLETTLRESTSSNIRTLKELALEHSKALKVVLKWIQEQQQAVEDQGQQLSQLQRQVPLRSGQKEKQIRTHHIQS
ncbi:uncharacterized protein si:dkey-114l24.2 [Megalops cyprinoides]|uniref:uncharacterized protein si:dkey-114l24.2 n=1 Tax=Megalops cyprinoides TaxID=118141 RepID=UPI001864E259|nr:uncharacterized protein si:dkey-114l24.2 [Megalops cyprinoides]